ncbi:MAG: molybdenum-binding protein [Candidatus Cloacimonadota bacterium]|jgi:molybdopterin-binding protein|nr:MAG: molybdenum-binding protein [Candidatus Cloacimonadota bacterium]
MKYGARNSFEGTVDSIEIDGIMAKTKIRIPADSIMCSVMTKESLEELGIKEGDKIKVLVKAVNVLLIKE